MVFNYVHFLSYEHVTFKTLPKRHIKGVDKKCYYYYYYCYLVVNHNNYYGVNVTHLSKGHVFEHLVSS